MYPSVQNALPQFFGTNEGKVKHMYIDVKGYVTTGVGYLIDSPSAAQALTWYHADGSQATPDEVASAWYAVDGARTQPKGQEQIGSIAEQGGNSGAMQALTDIRLTDSEVDKLFYQRMNQFEQTEKQSFPNYDSLPADAQLLILSMGWALGPGFSRGYPKFTAAINSEDFIEAGNQSTWQGITATRRADNMLLAANAAAVKKLGLNRSKLVYPSGDVAVAGGAASGGALLGLAIGGIAYGLWKIFGKG